DDADVAGCDDGGAGKNSCVRGGAVAAGMDDLSVGRGEDGADCSTTRKRGLLCAGGAVSASFDFADDGNASAGGGGGEDRGVFAETCERDDGGGLARRGDGILSGGWSAGNRLDGVWDIHDWARRQSRRPGEPVCDSGQGAGFERVWDR